MSEKIYEKFDSYDWEGDQAFKTGVQKVLDLKSISNTSPEAQPLIEKYKFFYFSKRNGPVDRDTFEQWKSTQPKSRSSGEGAQTTPDLSRPWFEQISGTNGSVYLATEIDNDSKGPSFDEIVELISSGKPVPGIRQIPDQLSTEPPSISSSPAPPRKPWESRVMNDRQ